MKRSWRGVILLAAVLFLNIVCTQLAVNAFFYDKFRLVLIYAACNVLLFPISLWIYKKERDRA
ncbi:hypothetical protein [Cohnella panacarvi]|uniref:hypothetical protein n=1 Tax=Cohnella panacarvi TaxID=400776 RepID=UPI00047E7B15|nr:hypothetical protein [Cohnella panacarvi]